MALRLQMIVTPFRCFKLPTYYAKRVRYEKVFNSDMLGVVEFIAGLEGEIVSPMYASPYPQLDHVKSSFNVDRRRVTIIGTDGVIAAYRSSLIRHYHFFDHFFTTFEGVDSVKLPFSTRVLTHVVSNTVNALLSECYECVDYLNPKDPLHYFLYDTKGCSVELLTKLILSLPLDSRMDLLSAYEAHPPRTELLGEVSLPMNAVGPLASVLLHHHDYENLISIFADYPSFLLCCDLPEALEMKVLSTGDFSNETVHIGIACRATIRKKVIGVISRAKTIDEAGSGMSMLGIDMPPYTNDPSPLPMPFYVDVGSSKLFVSIEHLEALMEKG